MHVAVGKDDALQVMKRHACDDASTQGVMLACRKLQTPERCSYPTVHIASWSAFPWSQFAREVALGRKLLYTSSVGTKTFILWGDFSMSRFETPTSIAAKHSTTRVYQLHITHDNTHHLSVTRADHGRNALVGRRLLRNSPAFG